MKATVSGQIVSRNGITLFMIDGSSRVLPNDGWRTKEILEAILPGLAKGQPVEIDLDPYGIVKHVEQATNGKVKLTEDLQIVTPSGAEIDGRALMQHVERAVYGDGMKAFANFMRAMEPVIKERKHSATELLEFLKGADLPLADDGSIIGYKMLYQTTDDGVMVDPHSRKVRQRLGSLVFMPASKVDDSRRQLCSTGLHVARRDYLYGYGGALLCLVKVKAGDVIAVPMTETSKMRACAYHIVHVFDKETSGKLIGNSHAKIKDVPEAMKALANVVAGNHPAILERVEVGAEGEHKVEVIENPKVRKESKPADLSVSTPERRTITPKDVRERVKKLTAGEKRDRDYQRKLERVQKDYDKSKAKGKPLSLRALAAKHGVDRDALSKNLKR